jgi:5'-nucleotidase
MKGTAMKNLRWALGVVLLTFLVALGASFTQAQQGKAALTILYTQEHHGQATPAIIAGVVDLGGLAARATAVKGVRDKVGAANVLLFDTGDILVGTPLSSVFKGEPDVLSMNAIGYDAMSPGNHEFDFELKEQRFKALSSLAKFPFLAANVKGADKLGITPNSGFIIKEAAGIKVGIVGITNPVTPEISSPPAGVTFEDPIATVNAILATQKANADIWIALTHEDSFRDVALLKGTGIDVIIGGHTFGFKGIVTRDTFKDPINDDTVPDAIKDQSTDASNPNGVYVRAGEGQLFGRLGSTLGRLDLTIENKKIAQAKSENIVILPDTKFNQDQVTAGKLKGPLVPSDAQISGILRPFTDDLSNRLKEVVGKTDVALEGRREIVRTRETNLGNLIADVYRETQKTDIGLQNSGGIRTSIPAGDIKISDVLAVMPFGNTVVRFNLKGSDLLASLENGVSQIEQGAGRFPQIAGMCFSFDKSKPAGQRVLKAFVGNKALEANATYSIASNNFTAGGGDGYVLFRDKRSAYRDSQFVDADVFADYLRAKGTVSPKVEGRITENGAKTACE